MLKKVLTWGGIAFVVFFVAFRPGAAMDVLATVGQTAIDIFAAVGRFFGSLVGA